MSIDDILASATAANQTGAFRKGLRLVLENECEYESDGRTIRTEHDPDDSGGLTFAGLDHASHDDFPFDHPRPCDVWLTYKDQYWSPLSCSQMPSQVGLVVFVQGVNQGKSEAGILLQEALNDYGSRLIIDGAIGQRTLQAAWKVPDSTGLAMAFLAKSKRHYAELIADHPRLAKYRNGWNNRIENLRKEITA
jgi:lysozyme family protein